MSTPRPESSSISQHQTLAPSQTSSFALQKDDVRTSDATTTSKSVDLETAQLFVPRDETIFTNIANKVLGKKHALKWYCISACGRFATLFAVLLALYGLLSLLQYTISSPEEYDYSDVIFDWPQVDPSYLKPTDPDFGPYNVLLDAHSHTTFSDGRWDLRSYY